MANKNIKPGDFKEEVVSGGKGNFDASKFAKILREQVRSGDYDLASGPRTGKDGVTRITLKKSNEQ